MAELASKVLTEITKALNTPSPVTKVSPPPGSSHPGTRAALKRCCTAWQRAYNAHMRAHNYDRFEKLDATHEASVAYCNAMPLLTGQDGVRNFIACVAHGILIDAIPREKSGSLLYAAQVAISTLREPGKPSRRKPQK